MIKKFNEMNENKPTLKVTEKKVSFVDWYDFEKFVKQVYDAPGYDFVAVQEGQNDSEYEFNPTGRIEDYQNTRAENIRNGEIDTYSNNLLFNCLVADGYIESGTYIVKVNW
jgi:hypothetical protein